MTRFQTAESPDPDARRSLLPRLAIALLCLLLIVGAGYQYANARASQNRLIALTGETLSEDRVETVRLRLERESSISFGELIAARALVYEVLEGSTEPRDVERDIQRLAEARQLASQALTAQPGSWQAAMFIGASTYLEWALRQDRRLYTESAAWQEPLLQAVQLAPGKREPRRFLAAAYLEVWPNLAGERKDKARMLLTEIFHDDPASFESLFPTWLAVARDLDEAFEPIPDRPSAWHFLARQYASANHWTAFQRSHARYLESMERYLERRLIKALSQLELGALYDGRSELLRVVVESPVSRRFAPIVARAIERYPPGLHGLSSTVALESWLEWTFNLNRLEKKGLPPLVVSRLAGVAERLSPEERALASLIGGEVDQAEQVERLAETFSTRSWAPYLIAKSRWHLSRAEAKEAMTALRWVDDETRLHSAAFSIAEERVATALGAPALKRATQQRLDAMRTESWRQAEWAWRNQRAAIVMLPSRRAAGLEIELAQVPEEGAVVEIRFDGEIRRLQPIYPRRRLDLELPIDTTLHRLEFQTLAGRTVQPGRVTLID